jgi:hypothetical protein
MTTPARRYHEALVHYLRKQVAFNTVPTHTISRHSMGVIPAGSQLAFGEANVKTAFSAAGTRVLTVGSNGTTANNMLSTIAEETVTTASITTAARRLTFSTDTEIFVKLTSVGTAAAAGLVEVVIGYIPPDAT